MTILNDDCIQIAIIDTKTQFIILFRHKENECFCRESRITNSIFLKWIFKITSKLRQLRLKEIVKWFIKRFLFILNFNSMIFLFECEKNISLIIRKGVIKFSQFDRKLRNMIVLWTALLRRRSAHNNEYIWFRLDSLNELKRYIDLQFFSVNFESLLFRFKV